MNVGTSSHILEALKRPDERESWIRDYLGRLSVEVDDDRDGHGTKLLHFHLDYSEGLDISAYTNRLWTFVIPVSVCDSDILDNGGSTSTTVMHRPVMSDGTVLGIKSVTSLMNSTDLSRHLFNISDEIWISSLRKDIEDVN